MSHIPPRITWSEAGENNTLIQDLVRGRGELYTLIQDLVRGRRELYTIIQDLVRGRRVLYTLIQDLGRGRREQYTNSRFGPRQERTTGTHQFNSVQETVSRDFSPRLKKTSWQSYSRLKSRFSEFFRFRQDIHEVHMSALFLTLQTRCPRNHRPSGHLIDYADIEGNFLRL